MSGEAGRQEPERSQYLVWILVVFGWASLGTVGWGQLQPVSSGVTALSSATHGATMS